MSFKACHKQKKPTLFKIGCALRGGRISFATKPQICSTKPRFHCKQSRMSNNLCKCGNPRRVNARNCKKCHAECTRKYRKNNVMTAEARFRSNARSYLHVYIRRGKIKKLDCQVCGSPFVEGHHKDYSKPLNVTWLCKMCHRLYHSAQRSRLGPRSSPREAGQSACSRAS